jgi:hypothetical protein
MRIPIIEDGVCIAPGYGSEMNAIRRVPRKTHEP